MLATLCFVLAASLAWADTTIEATFTTTGYKGMGASEMATTERYQGDKCFERKSFGFTGAILSRLTGGNEDTQITRVDKGVYWLLFPKDHAYRERSIVQPKDTKQKEGPAEEKAEGKPTTRITRCEFSVKTTGKSEAINGFPCEEYLITWLLEVEDIETKARAQSTMLTNLWTTPETAAIRQARAEEEKFRRALDKKLGYGYLGPEDSRRLGYEAVRDAMKAPKGDLDKDFKKFLAEVSKIKGYPIRTAVDWNMQEGKLETAAASEGPSLTGGVSGFLSGLAGRLIQKKAEDEMAGKPFFSCVTEVKKISVEATPAETYEVPAGYVKH
jgi:hypothetical protein